VLRICSSRAVPFRLFATILVVLLNLPSQPRPTDPSGDAHACVRAALTAMGDTQVRSLRTMGAAARGCRWSAQARPPD